MLFNPLAIFERAWHNLTLAARSLWLHKLRSVLSVLGIVIGTSAVIALMSFGEGSMQDALEDIKRMGATNIIIRSVKPVDDDSNTSSSFWIKYGLNEDDYQRLVNIGTITRSVPLRIFKQEMANLNHRHVGRVVGTTREYAAVHQVQMVAGRFLLDSENVQMKNHAVIGSELSDQLFHLENPLGKTIRIDLSGGKPLNFVVVGVLAPRMPTGGTGGSQAAENYNSDMYIPLETCNARFGPRIYYQQAGSRSGEEVVYHQITLTVDKMENVKPTARIVQALLKTRTGRKSKDWDMTVPLDKLEEAQRTKRRYQQMLFMIAAISLLVGGIGIMNIMLATVTERTRDIGIRRALGAKQRHITAQFLTEAVVQTSLGGLLGVAVGVGAVYCVPPVWEWITGTVLPAKLHVPSIFLSLSVAIGVGVLFGWYPARRAAKLDPIEALRHA